MSDIRMYVRHAVRDYTIWRKAYDDFDAERQTMGVIGHAVYQSIDDQNDVTIWHEFDSVEKAKSFVSSERLKAVMQAAGVQGPPQIWFTTRAD